MLKETEISFRRWLKEYETSLADNLEGGRLFSFAECFILFLLILLRQGIERFVTRTFYPPWIFFCFEGVIK